MLLAPSKLNRKGLSLTEILIGILVLGIGVISLATLFPIGLLRLRRAVNDVRGTITARSAWNEVKIRNLLAPPFGPPAIFFSAYPDNTVLSNSQWNAITPTTGPGLPVIIDPLWMIQAARSNFNIDQNGYFDTFGMADFDGTPGADFTGGEGLLRVRGGSVDMSTDPPTPGPYPLTLASAVFGSPDDLTYDEVIGRTRPLQEPVLPGNLPPRPAASLTPTNDVPFARNTLLRERRYTWMVIARKVDAAQIYHPGLDGIPGNFDDIRVNLGPNLINNAIPPSYMPQNAIDDDPARDFATGWPVPAPVGPFDVTVVAFYKRDFALRETVYANTENLINDTTLVPPLLTDLDPDPIFRATSRVATLIQRRDGIPFPEVPLNSYVMDTTFNSSPGGLRNAYVYRVTGRNQTLDLVTGLRIMTLTLDQPARANGQVLTVLRGAVGVFEKQVP